MDRGIRSRRTATPTVLQLQLHVRWTSTHQDSQTCIPSKYIASLRIGKQEGSTSDGLFLFGDEKSESGIELV